jgi:hypothetical protein
LDRVPRFSRRARVGDNENPHIAFIYSDLSRNRARLDRPPGGNRQARPNPCMRDMPADDAAGADDVCGDGHGHTVPGSAVTDRADAARRAVSHSGTYSCPHTGFPISADRQGIVWIKDRAGRGAASKQS